MVSTGSAWVYDKYVTDESFYIEQKKAQNNKLGIWADEKPCLLGYGANEKINFPRTFHSPKAANLFILAL